jgi:hypothetical protein
LCPARDHDCLSASVEEVAAVAAHLQAHPAVPLAVAHRQVVVAAHAEAAIPPDALRAVGPEQKRDELVVAVQPDVSQLEQLVWAREPQGVVLPELERVLRA